MTINNIETKWTTTTINKYGIIVVFGLCLVIGTFFADIQFSSDYQGSPLLTNKSVHRNHSDTVIRKTSVAVADGKSKVSQPLLVHYIRFYDTDPAVPGTSTYQQLCYLECLGVLSVMVHVKIVQILIHSNYPNYIPYNSCRNLTGQWDKIQTVYREKHERIGDKPVEFIHHSADVAKLEVLSEYGGIVLDFDVYLLKGRRIRQLLQRYDCIISQEFPTMMNAGFTACRKGSPWPLDLLVAYQTDFQPQDWLYNSGTVPFLLHSHSHKYRQTIYVDQTISNNPNGKAKWMMQGRNNIIDWKAKLGYHSFIDDCQFDLAALNTTKSSFGYLLRFVLAKSEKLKLSS